MLRRKVEDLETENERLQKEIRGVLSRTDTRMTKVGISIVTVQNILKLSCVKIIHYASLPIANLCDEVSHQYLQFTVKDFPLCLLLQLQPEINDLIQFTPENHTRE